MSHSDPTTPDQEDERRALLEAWLDGLVNDSGHVAKMHAEYMGKAMPDEVYNRFALLRDERIPWYKAQIRAALSAHQPVAQEAIAWSPAGYNKELAVDSTGKVRGEVCEHSIDPRWDARANDTRLGEYLNSDQAKAAVLAALAAPQPSQVATPKPNGGKDLAEKTESKVAAQLRERMDLYARSQITWGELRKDIEAALFAAPHPPVSAEAGKGVEK